MLLIDWLIDWSYFVTFVHRLQFSSTLKSFQREVASIFDDIQNDPRRHGQQLPYSQPGGMPRGRVYVRGWAPRIERSDVGRQSTIHDKGFGLARSVAYRPAAVADSSGYEAVKAHCLRTGSLWEDPDFPPVAHSLFYKRAPSAWPDIQWKRPHVSFLLKFCTFLCCIASCSGWSFSPKTQGCPKKLSHYRIVSK